jgi:peptide/nickel transport system substrate-binding protein
MTPCLLGGLGPRRHGEQVALGRPDPAPVLFQTEQGGDMSSNENKVVKLNDLYLQFRSGKISRRTLMTRASALGLAAGAFARFERSVPAFAQDASPIPSGQASKSLTREEYAAKLVEWWTDLKAPAKTGGTVIMGEIASANLSTYNMMLAADNPTNPVLNMVYETLDGTSPIDGQYVPALADFWEIAADGKTYTYHLNQDAKWHDGQPLTADDVVFSLAAQANPAVGSSYTATFNQAVKSFSKIDDHTVQVVATDVLAPVVFLGQSYCPIIAKHIWESIDPKDWAADGGSNGSDPSRVVGTGPLMFKEVNAGEGTSTFVRNPSYYDQSLLQAANMAQQGVSAPIIDTFVFSTWPDETAAVEALRSGDIDFYEAVPPADTASLQDPSNGTDVKLYDTYDFSFFGYNLDPSKTPLFQDVKVRQALLYALDRQSAVDNILLGFATVAQGSQPTLSIAYAPDQITTKYTFDVAKAKSLLADAGWADSDGDGILDKDGQKLSFKTMYASGSATNDQIVAFIQDSWKQIGVDAQPDPVDFAKVLLPAIEETFDYEMCFLGFSWDPTGDQSAMFSSTTYGQGGFNFMKYNNPQVDQLFQQANRELDQSKRVDELIQANNLINEDLPIAVLWFRKQRTGYQTRIQNFNPNANGGLLWTIPYTWINS